MRHVQDRAVFLRITQLVHQSSEVLYQFRIIIGEVINGAAIQTVAFNNRVNMRLDATREDAAVILTRLHHNSKVGKLRSAIINIQTIKVILKNTLCSIAFTDTALLINLHQNIKCIHKDMTAAHTRVNHFDLLGRDITVLNANRCELFLNICFLFCFIKEILPISF